MRHLHQLRVTRCKMRRSKARQQTAQKAKKRNKPRNPGPWHRQLRLAATRCRSAEIPPRGVEELRETLGKVHFPPQGGARGGAAGDGGAAIEYLLANWPRLSRSAKATILFGVHANISFDEN